MRRSELNLHVTLIRALRSSEERLSILQKASSDAIRNGLQDGYYQGIATENIALLTEAQAAEVQRLSQKVIALEKRIKAFLQTVQPESTRAILNYRYLCGYKWDAVAVMMGPGYSVHAVKSAAYRYLNKLQY